MHDVAVKKMRRGRPQSKVRFIITACHLSDRLYINHYASSSEAGFLPANSIAATRMNPIVANITELVT